MRNKVIAGALVVAILGGGWWVYARRSAAASAQAGVRYVQVPVRMGEIRSTISGTGPVASMNGAIVKANQAGTVSQVLAQDGDQVKAGDVILILENDNLYASLAQAEIDLTNNQASLENLLHPQTTAVRAQELKVESAILTLNQRRQEVQSLRMTAPVAGVVASVKTSAGSDVTAGTLLFTIYDDSTPTFLTSVPQAAALALQPGQAAHVDLTGFGRVEGTVAWVGGTATPSAGNKDATVPVAIDLPGISGVRAGMVGQASIEAEGLTYRIIAAGSIENDAVEVRAKVQGTVIQLPAREGTRVTAGDLLAQLENENLLVQLQQAENDLATQQQNLANLTNPAQDPAGQLRTLRTKVEQSQVTLATRRQDVEDLMVKAPVDGQVSALTARVGDKITANQTLFRVADYGAMQVTISVDELDIAKARVGQKAQITLDALPGKTFSGTVYKINPEGIFKNDIATFEVTILIEKSEGLLAGMNSTVNVVVESKQALYLPAQTVRVQQGRAFVQVLENNQPVQKEVQVGVRTTQQVEILGGLNEGDEVIATIVQPSNANPMSLFGGNRQQQNTPTFPAGTTPGGTTTTPAGGNRVRVPATGR